MRGGKRILERIFGRKKNTEENEYQLYIIPQIHGSDVIMKLTTSQLTALLGEIYYRNAEENELINGITCNKIFYEDPLEQIDNIPERVNCTREYPS